MHQYAVWRRVERLVEQSQTEKNPGRPALGQHRAQGLLAEAPKHGFPVARATQSHRLAAQQAISRIFEGGLDVDDSTEHDGVPFRFYEKGQGKDQGMDLGF